MKLQSKYFERHGRRISERPKMAIW